MSYGDCSERNGEAQVTLANFSTRSCTWKGTSGARGRNGGATGRAPNPGPKLLKKTRSPQTRNRISHRLAPEYPASHRKAQSCITQMHEPHRYPLDPNQPFTSGEDQHHYRQNSSGIAAGQGPSVPYRWHESNRRSKGPVVGGR